MGVETAFNQMIILFFGLIVGFIAAKLRIIDDKGSKVIVALVMNITLPLFIISSGLTSTRSVAGFDLFIFFLLSLVCYACAYGIGFVLSRLPFFKKDSRRLYIFMTTFGNTGFMGLPIIGSLLGSEAVLYASVFNLPFNVLVFSIGTYLVSDAKDLKSIEPKKFLNSCLVASLLAIVLYFTDFTFPDIVVESLNTVGSVSVPLAMIVTGVSLGGTSFKSIFTDAGAYVTTFAKIVLVPLVSFFILTFFIGNPTLVNTGVILMGMPIAVNATLLTLQYGGNVELSSKGVFLSTLFSIATIPLLVLFLS